MATVIRAAVIPAPAGLVWKVLKGLDRYGEWESGYVSSVYTSDQHEGVGTTRAVELRSPMGVRRASHVVTRWEDGAIIAWAANETNFPFLQTAEQTVTIRSQDGETVVDNQLVYELRYGVVGSLVDRLMFRRVVTGAADAFLISLARRVGSEDAGS